MVALLSDIKRNVCAYDMCVIICIGVDGALVLAKYLVFGYLAIFCAILLRSSVASHNLNGYTRNTFTVM